MSDNYSSEVNRSAVTPKDLLAQIIEARQKEDERLGGTPELTPPGTNRQSYRPGVHQSGGVRMDQGDAIGIPNLKPPGALVLPEVRQRIAKPNVEQQ